MHESAHGLFVKTPYVSRFIDWFNERTKDMDFNSNSYAINFELWGSDSYLDSLCWELARYDYLWGGDNPQPIIGLKNIYVNPKDITVVGKNKDTMRFMVNGVMCVKFNCKELAEEITHIKDKIKIDLIGRANINVWQGNESIQLLIDDIEYNVSSPLDF